MKMIIEIDDRDTTAAFKRALVQIAESLADGDVPVITGVRIRIGDSASPEGTARYWFSKATAD